MEMETNLFLFEAHLTVYIENLIESIGKILELAKDIE